MQIYKIVHNHCPNYLRDLLPPTAAERTVYQLRNDSSITLPACKTEALKNSFFPSTIRDWNALPNELRQSPTIESFKSNLRKIDEFKTSTPPKWYSYGKRRLNIILTQIRNSCSALRQHLTDNFVIDNPICQQCNLNRAEDAKHFFLECPKYATLRQTMTDVFQTETIPLNIMTITKGSIDKNYDENKILLDSVQTFILQSNRF